MKHYLEYDEVYFRNLSEMLESSAKDFGANNALAFANGFGYDYNKTNMLTTDLAKKLYGSGISKGEKIAIIGENSPHWVIAYFAIHRAAGVAVPMLTDFSSKEMTSILNHSEASIVFISKKQLPKFAEGFPETVKYVVMLENMEMFSTSMLFEQMGNLSEKYLEQEVSNDQNSTNFPICDKDDTAVIIYTSGTTGSSKGVMLSHDNLIADAIHTGSIHEVVASDRFLSVLPLAHTYEATIGMLIPVNAGASITYIEKAPTATVLAPILKKLRPTTMLTVPLIIEKIYRNKIRPGIQSKFITKMMVKFGPTRRIVYKAAGKKLEEFFGGELRFFGVGGAGIAPDVEKFLVESNFPYAVGYGLTETSPMLAGFGSSNQTYRSVGIAMAGVDIRIDNPDKKTGEGEIVAKGRNIMQGYFKNEELTKEVFTEDGYFRTGDLAIRDKNGIIYIKGRLKNMILGPNGENIYPEEIESVINECEHVNESLVLETKGKLVARIHLNLEPIEEKISTMKISAQEKQKEIQKKAEEILNELQTKVNQHLNKNSRLQAVILQIDPFEKTATQKIKRFLYTA